MKLLGNTKSMMTKIENGANVPHLEITEVVLVHYNIVNNGYQQDWRVLYTSVFIFWKTFSSEFSYIGLWFTDQNSKTLDIEDGINNNLVINYSIT